MTLDHVYLIFFTLVGACVGSFLNVVAYRLPTGQSLSRPGSHCPTCGKPIRWFDNIPVLAWFWLGGKCRACRARISVQYPLIEALTALLFGGWFAICYFTGLRPVYAEAGFGPTAAPFLAYLVLWAGLLICVLIDARYYVIPLTVTWWIAGAAAVAMSVAPYIDVRVFHPTGHAIPVIGLDHVPMALGGLAGLIVAVVLAWLGVLPRSFDEAPVEAEQDEAPDAFLAHPHPRREVLKECLFLAFPVMGAVLGSAIEVSQASVPVWLHALAGVALGYLAGGAVVWATRVLGTLAFGKEAMGLGDVHLMAAVGAVTGWREPVVAFFIAPFFGLAWAVGSAGLARVLQREVRIIPYGPHLALASAIVIVLREPIFGYLAALLGVSA